MPVLTRQATIRCSLYPKQTVIQQHICEGREEYTSSTKFYRHPTILHLVHSQESTTNN